MPKGLQIAAGALLVAGLLGWYASSQTTTFRYYQTLSEFQGDAQPGRPSRVHGYVVLGSIRRDVAGRQVRFSVQNDPPHAGGSAEASLPIVYTSLETPDLFQDGAEIVVEGRLRSGAPPAVFEATNVLAKCPSKFQAKSEDAAAPGAPGS